MNRCGLACLKDLENPDRIEIFEDMEKFSNFILRDRKKWWPEMPWPIDPLHQWSRQLEYPYAFWHLQQSKETEHKVLDAGSGITFFPYYLAMMGYKVTCVDNDIHLSAAFDQLNKTLPKLLSVTFHNSDLSSLPFEDNSFSKIYCISVMEHIPQADVGKVLKEFHRVLVPGGIIILTVDVFLQDDADALVRLDSFEDFTKNLSMHGFNPLFELTTRADLHNLLSTVFYLEHNPSLLPWNHPAKASLYHRARHWVKTKIMRRQMFEPLGVGLFVLGSSKVE